MLTSTSSVIIDLMKWIEEDEDTRVEKIRVLRDIMATPWALLIDAEELEKGKVQ